MSEEDIKALNPQDLKQYITECSLKLTSLKKIRKDYIKALNDASKDIESNLNLAMDVLEGKDSNLARKILIEVQGVLSDK